MGYVHDLTNLYKWKPWMREVSCHSIIEFLQPGSKILPNSKQAMLVEEVILKNLLAHSENENDHIEAGDNYSMIGKWNAEQLAVALHVQSKFNESSGNFSSISEFMKQQLITEETIPLIKDSLLKTSESFPRRHIVWSYLLQSMIPKGQTNLGDSHFKLIGSFLKIVVEKGLTDTNEQKATALIVSQELIASLPPRHLNLPLSSNMLRLILNSLAIGKKGKKQFLHDVARQVLETILQRISSEDTPSQTRLQLAKQILEVDPRYDAKTHVKIVSSLLYPSDSFEGASVKEQLDFINFLKAQVLENIASDSGEDESVDVMEIETEEDTPKKSFLHYAAGYLEVLHGSLLKMSVNLAASERAILVEEVLSFLMACAFFDCKDFNVPKQKLLKKNKDKLKDMSAESFNKAGKMIKDSTSGLLPLRIRSSCSAKFFSLLAECSNTTNTGRGTSKEEEEKADPIFLRFKLLSTVASGWAALEHCGAKLIRSVLSDDEIESRTLVGETCESVTKFQLSKSTDGHETLKSRCATSISSVALVLYLQLLRCAASGDGDEEEVDEELNDVLPDLVDAFRTLLDVNTEKIKKDHEEDKSKPINPLADLADAFVSVISIDFDGPSRGASTRLVCDAIRAGWSMSLSFVKSASASYDIGEVISSLMDEICEETQEDEDNKMSDIDDFEGEDSSQGSVDDDQYQKQDLDKRDEKLSSLKNADNIVPLKDGSSDSASPSESETEEDIELDPSHLQNLLLDDVDENVEELEHHEGADQALAKLIKLKQESRKAAQVERERIDVIRRIRCLTILDVLFSHKISSQLELGVVGSCLVRLLSARGALEKKTLATAQSLNREKLSNDLEVLLDKLTTLIKNKICKLKVSSVYDKESSTQFIREVFIQLKKSVNLKQNDCASAVLLFAIKSCQNEECKALISSELRETVEVWGKKKNTNINSVLFQEIISRNPTLAAESLLQPLIHVANNARNAYLHYESIRLAVMLTLKQDNNKTPVVNKTGMVSMIEALGLSLNKNDTTSKRSRETLKSVRDVVNLSKNFFLKESCVWDAVGSLIPALEKLRGSSESEIVQNSCIDLVSIVKTSYEEHKAIKEKENENNKMEEDKKSKKKKKKSKK